MKAVQYRQFGSPEVLEYVDTARPKPKAGEVLVKTESISVNFADTHIRKGIYPLMPTLPIVGLEASGTVVEKGREVDGVEVGQAVVVFGHHCYAEYVSLPQERVVVLTGAVDMDKAAALLVNYLTAYYMLHHQAHLKAGQTVLVHAAAGGVGTALLQLGKLAGATMMGLTRSAEKVDFARSQGCRHVINYKNSDVVEAVLQLTDDRGADIILDSVQGEGFGRNFDMLAAFGRLIFFGAAAGPADVDIMGMMRRHAAKSPSIGLFNLFTLFSLPELAAPTISRLVDYLSEGAIDPVIYEKLPLKDATRAHRLLESGVVTGKIILKP